MRAGELKFLKFFFSSGFTNKEKAGERFLEFSFDVLLDPWKYSEIWDSLMRSP